MFYMTVLQDCSTRLFCTTVLHDCSTRLFYKTVQQNCSTRLFYTIVLQDCSTRLFYKTVLHDFFTRLFYTTVLQDCSTRLFYKTVLQDCSTRLFYKAVLHDYLKMQKNRNKFMDPKMFSDITKEDIHFTAPDILSDMIDTIGEGDMGKSSDTNIDILRIQSDQIKANITNGCSKSPDQVISQDATVYSLFLRASFDDILTDQLNDLHLIDSQGHTALDLARTYCHLKAYRVLVDCGCKENWTERRQTKLQKLNNSDETSLLIGQLYKDAATGHLIDRLADQGYDNIPLDLTNSRGERALSIAVELGDTFTMENLIDIGAIPLTIDLQTAIDKHHAHCIASLLVSGVEFSNSMLDQILQVPFKVVLKTFLEKGDIKRQGSLGDKMMTLTTLHEPILHTATRGEILEAVKCIVRAGADVNCKNHNGETALDVAVRLKNNEIIKELLDAGADIKSSDLPDIFVHAAGSENTLELLRKLIQLGVDIDSKSCYGGITALMNSVIHSREENYNFLLLNGVDVNVIDSDGNTAILMRSKKEKKMVEQQIKRKALVNCQELNKKPI
ncbi:hypothetical protein Btru_037248 [Bulinus truncatus]|nr:hypothetical protein Btru_037248 [Bulinus truncatus]